MLSQPPERLGFLVALGRDLHPVGDVRVVAVDEVLVTQSLGGLTLMGEPVAPLERSGAERLERRRDLRFRWVVDGVDGSAVEAAAFVVAGPGGDAAVAAGTLACPAAFRDVRLDALPAGAEVG